MKNIFLAISLLFSMATYADQPQVASKIYSGDGQTPVTVTGTSLNSNVTNTVTVTGSVTATNPSVSATGAAVPASATFVGGSDGTNLRALKTSSTGVLSVDGSAVTQPVSGTFFQATQPISAASLPLPSGASTSAKQPALGTAGSASADVLTVQGIASMTALKVDGSAVTQPVSGTFFQATQPVSGTVTANAGTGTFAVSAASLPLPTGAATATNQTSVQGSVSGGAVAANSLLTGGQYNSTPPTLTNGQQAALQLDSSGALKTTASFAGTIGVTQSTSPWVVDGSGFTQPVSGTFWQATQPISAAALPLPSGAATSAKQPALGTAGSASADVLTVQGIASMTALKVDGSAVTQPISASALPLPSGAATAANQTSVQGSASGGTAAANSVLVGGIYNSTPPTLTNGQQASFQFDSSGSLKTTATFSGTVGVTQSTSPWVVSAASLPLPSGASTSAKQPALGTAGTASADVITVQGIASMTALKVDGSAVTQPVSGTFFQATQPVSGTVTANAGTGNFTVVQSTGTNLHVVVDSAPTTAVTQSGTWNVNSTPVVPTATTVKQAAVTIGTSAVRLTTDGAAPSSTRTLLVAQLLSTSTASCYFGSSGVTSSGATRGVQMFAGQSFSFNNDAGDYYAICDTTAQTFFITEQE